MAHLTDDSRGVGLALADGGTMGMSVANDKVVELAAFEARVAALEARVAALEGHARDHASGIDEAELAAHIAAAMDKRANEHAPTEVWTFPPRGAS